MALASIGIRMSMSTVKSAEKSLGRVLSRCIPFAKGRYSRIHIGNRYFDMNMSYRLALCKTIAQFMSHNNRRQLP